jgi:next-to-BRCA1 protein 1
VCHDLDFCANCEASPANEHNKTHPLIKFKTPVRHVSVTTSGEHQDGKRMPAMGDRTSTISKATETVAQSAINSVNPVQTVVDVKPVEADIPPPRPAKEPIAKPEPAVAAPWAPESKKEEEYRAVFIRDSVADGTILAPNHVFEQTWVLRNEGNTSWPAGCSVKFVGGDYMGHVDSAHPAGILELVSASESTVCYAPLAPGQEHSFTTLLRTPIRPGKSISYWRLTTPDGMRFGHRLWCDVVVRAAATSEVKPKAPSSSTSVKNEPLDESSQSSSIMIFPKLEKESPTASMHEEAKTETTVDAPEDALEACGDDEEWDASADGFLTDEEYDVLDASDEEFLEEQEKKLLKK